MPKLRVDIRILNERPSGAPSPTFATLHLTESSAVSIRAEPAAASTFSSSTRIHVGPVGLWPPETRPLRVAEEGEPMQKVERAQMYPVEGGYICPVEEGQTSLLAMEDTNYD